jgi:hypothetical protein
MRVRPSSSAPAATSCHRGTAIGSLMWRGIQFVDTFDNGRYLQTSVHFGGTEEDEAGQAGNGPAGTRVIYAKRINARTLATTVRPELQNGSGLSPDVLTSKRVMIGWGGFRNVIDYQMTVKLTAFHQSMFVEVPSAYMPPRFNTYYSFQGNHLYHANFMPGNPQPHISATGSLIAYDPADGVALGILSTKRAHFDVFDFQSVMKWNLPQLVQPARPGTYSWDIKLVVGSLQQVVKTLNLLRHIPGIVSATRTAKVATIAASEARVNHPNGAGVHHAASGVAGGGPAAVGKSPVGSPGKWSAGAGNKSGAAAGSKAGSSHHR